MDVGLEWEIEPGEKFIYGQSFRASGPSSTYEMRTPMLGRHQLDNAVTAVAAAEAVRSRGCEIPDLAIVDGVAMTRVPGRMEVMGQRPLVVADGAHNVESAAALASALKDYFEWRRCFFILGTLSDKDIRGMGFKLARLAEMIVCTRVNSPRAMDPYVMLQEVGFLGPMAVVEETTAAAIDTVMAHAAEDDLVCITGSLYLVAEARALLLGESVRQA
jgi:dihydrofolate synthase/folylpolyglutamate synthase